MSIIFIPDATGYTHKDHSLDCTLCFIDIGKWSFSGTFGAMSKTFYCEDVLAKNNNKCNFNINLFFNYCLIPYSCLLNQK